jgi:hypothetical protein
MQKAIADSLDARNIERAAQRRLEQCGYDALKHIACRFRRGAMTLRGTVPMYFHKQLAQEAVRDLKHVDVIVNDIKVVPW